MLQVTLINTCTMLLKRKKCTVLDICLMFYYRVFSDRLVEERDTETFVNIMTEKLGSLFDQTYHNICPNKQPPIFGELQSEIVLMQTELGEGVFMLF